MDKKPSNLGLNSGAIPSGVSDAEALALFRKNQLNHPMTRVPYAMQVRDEMAKHSAEKKKKG
ncbi:hypothetical protein [Thermomonas sp.]|uniref:hypothetical protein n=1 Tax=Thermomonas sp. TaxID=1971895 RepID=UPI0035B3CB86